MTDAEIERVAMEAGMRIDSRAWETGSKKFRQAFARAIIAQAMEEAAQVCIAHSERCDDNREFSTAITCGRKIRAIIPSTKEGHEDQ